VGLVFVVLIGYLILTGVRVGKHAPVMWALDITNFVSGSASATQAAYLRHLFPVPPEVAPPASIASLKP